MEKTKEFGKTIRVNRIEPMSRSGFMRLNSSAKSTFLSATYHHQFSGFVEYQYIETEQAIAKWLQSNFEDGTYVILPYEYNPKIKRKSLGKKLIEIETFSVGENKMDYNVIDDKRIKRMSWYLGKEL